MSEEPEEVLKILTLGESGVGKTCILRRFVENKFLKNHLATIGIDFKAKNIRINDKLIKLKIWDTAGQERFRNITKQYFNGADGIILVYDMCDESSFEKINEWVDQIKTNTQDSEIGMILLANKSDMPNRTVSEEDGRNLAKKLNVSYFETSALNGQGIQEAFMRLAKDILKKMGKNPSENDNSIKIDKTKPAKKDDGCC